MSRALKVLHEGEETYYSHPDRYPVRVKAAWDWKTVHRYEERVRAEALLLRAPRNKTWLETIVRFPAPGELYVCCNDDYHFEELIHIAQIVILQKTKETSVAIEATRQAAELAKKKDRSFSRELKPLRTATAALAIGRWAMDRKLGIWMKYGTFVAPICEMVDDPPFHADLVAGPKGPALEKSLEAFEKWFTDHRAQLEHEAAVERPHLLSLANELHQTIE